MLRFESPARFLNISFKSTVLNSSFHTHPARICSPDLIKSIYWLRQSRHHIVWVVTVKSVPTLQHGPVSRVGDGEHVRRNLVSLDALVPLHDLLRVDRQSLVGVDDDAEQPWVRLKQRKLNKNLFNNKAKSYS